MADSRTKRTPLPTQEDRLVQYRHRLRDNASLTMDEWGDYNRIEKSLDPKGYEQRRAIGRLNTKTADACGLPLSNLAIAVAAQQHFSNASLPRLPRVRIPASLDELNAWIAEGLHPDAVVVEQYSDNVLYAHSGDTLAGSIKHASHRLMDGFAHQRIIVVEPNDG